MESVGLPGSPLPPTPHRVGIGWGCGAPDFLLGRVIGLTAFHLGTLMSYQWPLTDLKL